MTRIQKLERCGSHVRCAQDHISAVSFPGLYKELQGLIAEIDTLIEFEKIHKVTRAAEDEEQHFYVDDGSRYCAVCGCPKGYAVHAKEAK